MIGSRIFKSRGMCIWVWVLQTVIEAQGQDLGAVCSVEVLSSPGELNWVHSDSNYRHTETDTVYLCNNKVIHILVLFMLL